MTKLNPTQASFCNSQYWLVYFIFFLSGASALICEISWSRQIGLMFGHTVHAASIVLASYFFGMAIGYWFGAKWSLRYRPLMGYAVAEVIVGLWTFAVPQIIQISESATFAPWLSNSSLTLQTCGRAGFAFFLLLPATIALGVTLPMMAQYFSTSPCASRSGPDTSARVSLAYAVNTAGALSGVLAATFFLLVTIGVRKSSYCAAAISLLCAIIALLILRRDLRTTPILRDLDTDKDLPLESETFIENSASREANPKSSRATCPPSTPMLLSLTILSGGGALALQVLYTRMFSLVFHNSTYTFGVVVATWLASLSIGAMLAGWLQKKMSCRSLIGLASATGATAIVSSSLIFAGLTQLKYFNFGDSFATYLAGALLVVLAVIGPAVTCLGMVLPLVWSLAGTQKKAGLIVGRLTAINTLAAATGCLVASFFLLPAIGLWYSIVMIAGLFFIAGFWILLSERHLKTASLLAIAFGTISSLALHPLDLEHPKDGEKLIQRWNSAFGWIDVMQVTQTGAFRIRQNLHYGFGTTGKYAREYRQAHIPLLLHQKPEDVLFMGLGTGLTVGGAIPHQPVKRIVAVELIKEVVEAARTLSDDNYGAVDHPKVKIKVDDARHFLLANTKNYDVIVSDLFVPWESKSGYLYTVENYRVAASRLKPNGVFCQWLPLYQLGEREFELIADSFSSVFQHTTVWWGQLNSNYPVIALIGSESTLEFDSTQITQKLDNLKQKGGMSDPKIETAERLSDLYVGDWNVDANAIFNTDEYPRVEFLTPISNRNRQMIQGETLKRYFDVFYKLPTRSVEFSKPGNSIHRRTRQHLILFGK